MFSQSTPNFGLPQYQANDTLNVLVDFNGAMSDIDTAMQDNKLAAQGAQNTANTADGKADTNTLNISTLDGQINDPATGLAHEISQIGGNVSTINALIGNGTPTTTDQTIIGAINELNSGKVDDSALSGLYLMKTHHAQVMAVNDGLKTYGMLMAEAVTALKSIINGLTVKQFLRVTGVDAFIPEMIFYSPDYVANDTVNIQASNAQVNLVPDSCDFWTAFFNESACKLVAGTYGGASEGFTDETNVVSGTIVRIYYDIYEKIS